MKPSFWAKLFDYSLFYLIAGGIASYLQLFYDDLLLFSALMAVLFFVWTLLEALLLTTRGATLGYSLMGITVSDAKGKKLSFKAALKKALWINKDSIEIKQTTQSKARKWLALAISLLCVAFPFTLPYVEYSQPTTELAQRIEGWISYFSSQKKFSINFPQDPKETLKQFPLPNSKDGLSYYELTSSRTEKISYAIGYLDMPRKWSFASKNTLLKGAMDIVLKHEANAELVSKEIVSYQKFSAMNFHLKKDGEEIKGRIILAGRTLYKLAVNYPAPLEQEAEHQTFFNSFHIHK